MSEIRDDGKSEAILKDKNARQQMLFGFDKVPATDTLLTFAAAISDL